MPPSGSASPPCAGQPPANCTPACRPARAHQSAATSRRPALRTGFFAQTSVGTTRVGTRGSFSHWSSWSPRPFSSRRIAIAPICMLSKPFIVGPLSAITSPAGRPDPRAASTCGCSNGEKRFQEIPRDSRRFQEIPGDSNGEAGHPGRTHRDRPELLLVVLEREPNLLPRQRDRLHVARTPPRLRAQRECQCRGSLRRKDCSNGWAG